MCNMVVCHLPISCRTLLKRAKSRECKWEWCVVKANKHKTQVKKQKLCSRSSICIDEYSARARLAVGAAFDHKNQVIDIGVRLRAAGDARNAFRHFFCCVLVFVVIGAAAGQTRSSIRMLREGRQHHRLCWRQYSFAFVREKLVNQPRALCGWLLGGRNVDM